MTSRNGSSAHPNAEDGAAPLRGLMANGLGLAAAGANVIMQLSLLPIGHGVAESVVHTGSLYRHPIKRTRTTLGYIMIALFGTEHERDVLRREVNRQHRQVRSSPNSPVAYDAFDPELQLWVAACMYRGLYDTVTVLHDDVDPRALDTLYARCARFATTLQVPDAMWPKDRDAFDAYWARQVREVALDDVTRRYLLGIASLTFLPSPLRVVLAPLHRIVTAGFLPATFRDELGLAWDQRRQVVFHAFVATLRGVNRLAPRALREFPLNVVLWDARRRIRQGRRFV